MRVNILNYLFLYRAFLDLMLYSTVCHSPIHTHIRAVHLCAALFLSAAIRTSGSRARTLWHADVEDWDRTADFLVHRSSPQPQLKSRAGVLILCTDAFTTAKQILHIIQVRGGEARCSERVETGSDVVTWQHTDTDVRSYHHKLSWYARLCQHIFAEIFFFFSFFLFLRLLCVRTATYWLLLDLYGHYTRRSGG